MVSTIRADSLRVLPGAADPGTPSAAKASVRGVEDPPAPPKHRAGEVDSLRVTPIARPDERHVLMNPKVAVLRPRRIVKLNRAACDANGDRRLPASCLVSPDPFEAAIRDQLPYVMQAPTVSVPLSEASFFLAMPFLLSATTLRSHTRQPAFGLRGRLRAKNVALRYIHERPLGVNPPLRRCMPKRWVVRGCHLCDG